MYIAPIPKYILGKDVLSGLTLQTTSGEFKLRVCFIKQIRGDAKQTLVILPVSQRVMAIKHYPLPRGHEEVTGTIKELAKVGIIRPTHSGYKSLIWL